MSTVRQRVLAVALVLLACPGLGMAQEPVGVVTTLAGHATRTASAPGQTPAPLRFCSHARHWLTQPTISGASITTSSVWASCSRKGPMYSLMVSA